MNNIVNTTTAAIYSLHETPVVILARTQHHLVVMQVSGQEAAHTPFIHLLPPATILKLYEPS